MSQSCNFFCDDVVQTKGKLVFQVLKILIGLYKLKEACVPSIENNDRTTAF